MNVAKLFFASSEEVFVVATDKLEVLLNNYNPDLHDQIFQGLHHFGRFVATQGGKECTLQECFTTVPIEFSLDQQTILNLHLLSELVCSLPTDKHESLCVTPGVYEFCLNLMNDLNKQDNDTLTELKKHMKLEPVLDILKFINAGNTALRDEITINFIQAVASPYPAYQFKLRQICEHISCSIFYFG